MTDFHTVRFHDLRRDLLFHLAGDHLDRLRHRDWLISREVEGFTVHALVHLLGEHTISLCRVLHVEIIPHRASGVADHRGLIGVKLEDRARHQAVHLHISRAVHIGAARDADGNVERLVECLRDHVCRRFRHFIRIRCLEMMRVFRVWKHVVISIRLVGRGDDHLTHAGVAFACLEDFPGALDIDLERVERIVDGLVDDSLRREMEDGIDLVPPHDLVHEGEVADVAANDHLLCIEMLRFKNSIRIFLVYQDDRPNAGSYQLLDDIAAQKAVASRYQYVPLMPKVFHDERVCTMIAYSTKTRKYGAFAPLSGPSGAADIRSPFRGWRNPDVRL